jgi:electron transport complex protein RnfA
MGGAVTVVMALASGLPSVIANYLLKFSIGGKTIELGFLRVLLFILVIAALVQMVEIILKKISPSLYQALGIFLPLITTNCAVLGVAILVVSKEFTFGGEPHMLNLAGSVVYAIASALGFGLAMTLFAGLREQLDLNNVPKAMKGVPIALITAGILAMAFMGFSGLV